MRPQTGHQGAWTSYCPLIKDEAQPRRVCPRAWVWAGQEDGRKVVEGQMLENTGQE